MIKCAMPSAECSKAPSKKTQTFIHAKPPVAKYILVKQSEQTLVLRWTRGRKTKKSTIRSSRGEKNKPGQDQNLGQCNAQPAQSKLKTNGYLHTFDGCILLYLARQLSKCSETSCARSALQNCARFSRSNVWTEQG